MLSYYGNVVSAKQTGTMNKLHAYKQSQVSV